MAKYKVAGKGYRTKIDHYLGATCGKCRRKIAQKRPAIGVRNGTSFSYYHITCWPKSWAFKHQPKRK